MIVVPPRGPFPTELAIVGEAPGRDEVTYRTAFIGQAGTLLNQMLAEAVIHPASCYITNVFKIRPENNDVEHFFTAKKLGAAGVPPLRKGKYLPPSNVFWLDLLAAELRACQPKLILALGNTALWALTGLSGIAKLRGVIHSSPHGPVLGTFHPAAVLRVWPYRSVVVGDLVKAKQFLDGNIHSPGDDLYELVLNPSVADFPSFRSRILDAEGLGVDIETAKGQITMVGFSTSPTSGFCIPFWDPRSNLSYWSSADEEVLAWQFVQWALATEVPKVLHNGLYDLQYLARVTNKFRGLQDDTILLHHALQIEMKKDLGTLGANYLNRPAWKMLRHRKGDEQVKRDE